MLPFGVTIPASVPQRSEIPEELMNYPVQREISFISVHNKGLKQPLFLSKAFMIIIYFNFYKVNFWIENKVSNLLIIIV
jgi:hypothetical protein